MPRTSTTAPFCPWSTSRRACRPASATTPRRTPSRSTHRTPPTSTSPRTRHDGLGQLRGLGRPGLDPDLGVLDPDRHQRCPGRDGAVTGTASEMITRARRSTRCQCLGRRRRHHSVRGQRPGEPAGRRQLRRRETHSFTLDPSNAAKHLAQNATMTVSVSYGVSDGLASTPTSVSWTLTGTNDAPVVTGAVTGTASE